MNRFSLQVLLCGAALLAGVSARADAIRHPTAVFDGLDKITGRIISFDVAIDETVQFGTLQITPRICMTRPQTEAPMTQGFVEVDEIENVKQAKRIFSGWMFAASPGLHGVEHPVYDVWLKNCKGGKEIVAEPASAPDGARAAAECFAGARDAAAQGAPHHHAAKSGRAACRCAAAELAARRPARRSPCRSPRTRPIPTRSPPSLALPSRSARRPAPRPRTPRQRPRPSRKNRGAGARRLRRRRSTARREPTRRRETPPCAAKDWSR